MDRNSSEPSNLVIKVQHGDTLRRFRANVHGQAMDMDMASLKAKIVTLFKLKLDAQVHLTYTDEDGDTVTLDTDNELNDAVIMQRLNPLRINFQLMSPDPRDRQASKDASGLPRFGMQPPYDKSAVGELSIEPVSSSTMLEEIFDQLSKVELGSASQPSQTRSGSSVAPEVTSAGRQDLFIDEKPEHADQPILNEQVKERCNKQFESAKLSHAAPTQTANPPEVNVDNVHTKQNEAFSNWLNSVWTIFKNCLGGLCEEKGKALIDGDFSVTPLADSSKYKQSQTYGTAPVDNKFSDNANKQSIFDTASMTSHVPPVSLVTVVAALFIGASIVMVVNCIQSGVHTTDPI